MQCREPALFPEHVCLPQQMRLGEVLVQRGDDLSLDRWVSMEVRLREILPEAFNEVMNGRVRLFAGPDVEGDMGLAPSTGERDIRELERKRREGARVLSGLDEELVDGCLRRVNHLAGHLRHGLARLHRGLRHQEDVARRGGVDDVARVVEPLELGLGEDLSQVERHERLHLTAPSGPQPGPAREVVRAAQLPRAFGSNLRELRKRRSVEIHRQIPSLNPRHLPARRLGEPELFARQIKLLQLRLLSPGRESEVTLA